MKKLISLIVPVYNVERYLKRCIDSIISQSYKNIEIILVDDGSPDSSGIICDQYQKRDNRIKVIHKKNGGLSSARNAGLTLASGEFICFVDSDDWISSDMCEYMLSLQQEYNADVVQIEYVIAKEFLINTYKRKISTCCIEGRDNILKEYLENGMKEIKSYPVWTKLYRKECFKGIIFPEGQLYEDVVTNYDILSNSLKYVISNKICYYYFVNPCSITRGLFKKKDFDYIKVGEQISNRTVHEDLLRPYGLMTKARTNFMCICKMLKYSIEPGAYSKEQVYKMIDNIREGYWILLKSKMKWNRKIIMTIICANKKLTNLMVRRNVR